MPTIPQYDSGQVQQQALPGARVSTDASIEAFGGTSSRTNFGDAAAGALDKTAQIVTQEKHKADDVATQQAWAQGVQAKNDALYNPQTGAYTKKGQDALGVADEYGQRYSDTLDKIQEGLANPDQKEMFQNIRTHLATDLNDSLERHTFTESQKFQAETLDSGLGVSRDDAVQNYQNPGAVEKNIKMQQDLLADYASKNNMPADTLKQKLAESQSKTYTAVISRMVANGQDDVAQKFYDQNKGGITGSDATAIEKELHGAQIISTGGNLYDQVKGFKLSDGAPDEDKMRAVVMAQDGYSDQDKLKMWDFVKARSGEDIKNQSRADLSSDRDFMNQALDARKQNVPLASAMNLVNQLGKDDYDKSIKAQAIQKIYAPPSESDPGTFINLWEKVKNGESSKTDIDQAFQKGTINTSDWRKLREDYFNTSANGSDPLEKAGWERVKALADANYGGNKQDREGFMYEMHVLGEGKSPEEIWKIAQDKTKGDPNTGIWGWGQTAQWRSDLQKMDAQNLGWGKLYQDVGKNETTAIGQGALYSGKKTWGMGDVDSFASQFGGYDAIKAGTPVNNAIQSLVKRNQLATPANVKAVLDRYKDGKF